MRLSIVVLSWNTRDLLRACLASLRAAEQPEPTEVIVVDNASDDGSADMVAAEFPEVVLLCNAENQGFARGCNQGMELSTGEYVLLLNSDTEVRGRVLVRLVEFLDAHREYGAAAPRLSNPDGSIQRASKRFPRLRTALFFGPPMERWFPDSAELRRYTMRDWDHASERDVEQPPAACLCLRKSALDVVGRFDEDLWLFYNDVDLSLRLARAGFATRYLPDVEVLHHEGASTSKFKPFLTVWQENRLRFFRKHHGRAAGWWVKLCVALSLADYAQIEWRKRLRGEPAERMAPIFRMFFAFLRR